MSHSAEELPQVQIVEDTQGEDLPLLDIRNLDITFNTAAGPAKAVRGANLTVMPGQTVAIVGESGSGKSTTALAAIGLLQEMVRLPTARSCSTERTWLPREASESWLCEGTQSVWFRRIRCRT